MEVFPVHQPALPADEGEGLAVGPAQRSLAGALADLALDLPEAAAAGSAADRGEPASHGEGREYAEKDDQGPPHRPGQNLRPHGKPEAHLQPTLFPLGEGGSRRTLMLGPAPTSGLAQR